MFSGVAYDIQPLQISFTRVMADLRPRLSNEEPKESGSRKRKPTVAGQVRPGAWIYTTNRRALVLETAILHEDPTQEGVGRTGCPRPSRPVPSLSAALRFRRQTEVAAAALPEYEKLSCNRHESRWSTSKLLA